MKCISVYTNNFEVFSDLMDKVMTTSFAEDEELEIDGVTVSESGFVPHHYIERMKTKPDVAVMKVKDQEITILQHGNVFEILLPENGNMVH